MVRQGQESALQQHLPIAVVELCIPMALFDNTNSRWSAHAAIHAMHGERDGGAHAFECMTKAGWPGQHRHTYKRVVLPRIRGG